MSPTRVPPRELADHLLAHGRPVVTLGEVADLLGTTEAVAASAVAPLRRSNKLFSPRPGLYIAVPPQYRTWGSPPALDFVDPMMGAAGRRYYVGFLSAAELHGASHQRPQVFQVVVNARLKDRDYGRVRVVFHQAKDVAKRPTVKVNTATGQARVSTPEVTVFDLVSDPKAGAGWGNVATVAGEFLEDAKLDATRLAEAAATYSTSTLRRTGWLLDYLAATYGPSVDTAPLHVAASARTDAAADPGGSPSWPRVYLDADAAARGSSDKRWGVVANIEIEADL
jgi:predicted transcriptional regulator of viral defense system